MKKVIHFFLTLITLLLTLTTYMSLLFIILFCSIKQVLSKENIIALTKQTELKELIGPKIDRDIYTILERVGIPSENAEYILESIQAKEQLGIYFADSLEALLYEKEQPTLSEQQLVEIFQNAFDQSLIDIVPDIEYGQQELQLIHQKIEYFTPKIIEKIPHAKTIIENKLTENEDKTKEIKKMYQIIELYQNINNKMSLIIISLCFQLFLIFLIKIKKFHYMKWMTLPFILTAGTLFYLKKQLSLIIYQNIPKQIEFMKDLLDDFMYSIYNSWNQTISICLILIVLLLAIKLLTLFIPIRASKKDMAKL